ncbi:MAG: hypothetical protein HOV67_01515 [Kribbellaceae bacterium]|nr:hypothetical protein [Kribbellaceae bacterium]
MNGRTAEDNRIPVKGTGSTNGTSNGHGPQPAANLGAPAEWRPGQQIAEIKAPKSEWLSEVRDRPRDPNGTTLRQFNTPVRVDEIAVAAMTLAEDLHAATQNMPESVELRRFRRELDQAATTFRDIASKLEVTAGKLVRLAANEGQACGVGWGVCPEHGLTLMNMGDTATCHVLGCGRENVGEVERCEHPVAYRVVDAAGPSLLTCAGHAIACRLYFDNPVITATADSMELF